MGAEPALRLGLSRRLPIGGGAPVDDAAQVLAMIARVSLCPACIAHKTGIPVSRVEGLLTTVAETIALNVAPRPCAACLATKVTYSFDGHATVPGRTAPVRGTNGMQRTMLNFFEQHQGAAFCVDCITAKRFPGKDLDGPMRLLEGYGVRRYHDRCSVCGKQRLVARLPAAN